MSQIPGTITVTAPIAPSDTTDSYGSHISTYGVGGWREVANTTARDAIPTDRRLEGMAVFVNATNTLYILQGGITNSDWVEYTLDSPLLPTADEKAALAGTNGDPSVTNKYVTNSDPRLDIEVPAAIEDNSNSSSPNYYVGMVVTVDGQTTLTTSAIPVSKSSFSLYLNGQLCIDGIDYSIVLSTKTITWLDPSGLTLKTTDGLIARYGEAIGGAGTNYLTDTGTVLQPINPRGFNVATGQSYFLNGTNISSVFAATTDSRFPTADEKDAMDAAASPDSGNPFATMDDLQTMPTVDEKKAMDYAHTPSQSNPFATLADVGGGAVSSVFGRTGNVVAVSGDYLASQINNDSSVPGATVKDALNTVQSNGVTLNTTQTITGAKTFTPTTDFSNNINVAKTVVIGGVSNGALSVKNLDNDAFFSATPVGIYCSQPLYVFNGFRDANVTTAIDFSDVDNPALTTTNQTIVGAINEIKASVGSIEETVNITYQGSQIETTIIPAYIVMDMTTKAVVFRTPCIRAHKDDNGTTTFYAPAYSIPLQYLPANDFLEFTIPTHQHDGYAIGLLRINCTDSRMYLYYDLEENGFAGTSSDTVGMRDSDAYYTFSWVARN